MSGLVCSLDVRVVNVDSDGVPTGNYIGLVNPVKLSINTPDPDRKQRISKERDSYGNALGEIVTPKPTEIEFTTDETGDAQVLAWALNGEAIGYSQSSATVTEAVTAVLKGQWTRLPHVSISSVVVKNSAGDTTYVANTDYIVDPVSGWLKPTDGGAIADGNVKVSYSAAAVTGDTIKAGTVPNLRVRIEGDGYNLDTGKPVRVLVPMTTLSSSGGLDLMSADYTQATLKGTAIKVGSQAPVEITYVN